MIILPDGQMPWPRVSGGDHCHKAPNLVLPGKHVQRVYTATIPNGHSDGVLISTYHPVPSGKGLAINAKVPKWAREGRMHRQVDM